MQDVSLTVLFIQAAVKQPWTRRRSVKEIQMRSYRFPWDSLRFRHKETHIVVNVMHLLLFLLHPSWQDEISNNNISYFICIILFKVDHNSRRDGRNLTRISTLCFVYNEEDPLIFLDGRRDKRRRKKLRFYFLSISSQDVAFYLLSLIVLSLSLFSISLVSLLMLCYCIC